VIITGESMVDDGGILLRHVCQNKSMGLLIWAVE